jgi:hypothetical protein
MKIEQTMTIHFAANTKEMIRRGFAPPPNTDGKIGKTAVQVPLAQLTAEQRHLLSCITTPKGNIYECQPHLGIRSDGLYYAAYHPAIIHTVELAEPTLSGVREALDEAIAAATHHIADMDAAAAKIKEQDTDRYNTIVAIDTHPEAVAFLSSLRSLTPEETITTSTIDDRSYSIYHTGANRKRAEFSIPLPTEASNLRHDAIERVNTFFRDARTSHEAAKAAQMQQKLDAELKAEAARLDAEAARLETARSWILTHGTEEEKTLLAIGMFDLSKFDMDARHYSENPPPRTVSPTSKAALEFLQPAEKLDPALHGQSVIDLQSTYPADAYTMHFLEHSSDYGERAVVVIHVETAMRMVAWLSYPEDVLVRGDLDPETYCAEGISLVMKELCIPRTAASWPIHGLRARVREWREDVREYRDELKSLGLWAGK